MSLQIRAFIQGEQKFLDLYRDEPLLLSLSFAEVQDITKKNSTFSKAFNVPGSQRNNEIFNFFYDLNSVPTTFNPNNKFDATLMWDGYEILQGHIRLNGVSITNDEIIYQITFYNQVGDLAANIGDKFLRDLNLSALTHPYSFNVITDSTLDPSLFPLTGATNYSYQNGKTFWGLYNIGYEYFSGTTLNDAITPLLQFSPLVSGSTGFSYIPQVGNFDYSNTPVNDYYFKPTLQIKTLYKAICLEAGYEIQSDFFDTDYFSKFYLPQKFLDETVYSRNAVQACYKYGPQDYNFSSFISTSYTNPVSGLTCNTLGFTGNTTSFTIPSEYQDNYTFRFTWSMIGDCSFGFGFEPRIALYFDDGTDQTQLYATIWCDDATQNVSIDRTFILTGETQLSFYLTGLFTQVSGFTAEIYQGPRFIPNGLNINYAEEFPENDYSQIDFIQSVNKYFNLVVVPNPDKPRNLIVEPIIDYIGKGNTLDWTTKIDVNQGQSLYPTTSLINGTLDYEFKLDQDYANQDFKTQTNRTFGTDKIKLNLEYKDTTTKFDYIFSSPIDITINNSYVPLITLSSMSKVKTVDRNGQSQQTFVPFKILPKIIFRGPTLPNDNWGFVGGDIPVGTCSSGITVYTDIATTVYVNDCNGVQQGYTLSAGFNVLTGCWDWSTMRIPLVVYPYPNWSITSTGTTCNTIPTIYQSWYVNSTQFDRFTNLNRFTTYPFNYNNFSHYCNFRGEDKTDITPSEFSFIAKDLYDIYYKPYVDDLINLENKIYSAKIYLYPQEIQQLRWNEKILINNTYFRINRITNFSMTEPGICDIELVKLTKEYPGHPVLYYDLTPCSGGTELHSNSDLNFHLYTYAGNYVKLYDDSLNYLGCYNVSISEYNSGYTYSHYYISSGYTSNLVNVYPDCGCTGRTAMNLIQEEPDTPRYFVYSGTECNGNTNYVFQSTGSSLDTTGLIYKIYDTTTQIDVCLSGITGTFAQITPYTEIGSYSACTDCSCILCYTYSMTGNTSGVVRWRDCDGISTDTYLLAGETFTITCPGARLGTVDGDITLSAGTLCFNGCITPTPTPTIPPTPSPTPTIPLTPSPTATSITPTPTGTPENTPTPTPTQPTYGCTQYMNYSGFGWIGDYTDCTGIPYTATYIAPGNGVCAINGTPFTISGVDLSPTFACTY